MQGKVLGIPVLIIFVVIATAILVDIPMVLMQVQVMSAINKRMVLVSPAVNQVVPTVATDSSQLASPTPKAKPTPKPSPKTTQEVVQ